MDFLVLERDEDRTNEPGPKQHHAPPRSPRRTRQLSLRESRGQDTRLPLLVLHNALAEKVQLIFVHAEDFIFLVFCALAIGFMFPSTEQNILQEIEVAKKCLELDLAQAADRYKEVSGTL
jgi:hypothetical protein